VIRIESATKRYGDTVAVNNLSLNVQKGEVCVLIGPSGCGKTTTLRMINRLIEPSDGRILINEADNRHARPEELRRSIGYAIQSVGLFPHMTVAENIGVVPSILRWDRLRTEARTAELLALVGLKPDAYFSKYPSQLSGGEAQRVGVARALAADPPILLMDEPFGAVDPLTRERLQQQFMDIQRRLQKTVVLVTHDLDEAIRLADRVAVMRAGGLVQYSTPEELLAHPADEFVRDFVGTDRALKRLSRIAATSLMKPATSVRAKELSTLADTTRLPRYVWVVDDSNRLLGWADTERGSANAREAQISNADVERIAIRETSSLREALSRMLGQGIRTIPVVGADWQLMGEITLRDVEEATAE
jgi:osmoprotectant transport system ATP-binding protein